MSNDSQDYPLFAEKYELVRRLTMGGMGEIYLACQMGLSGVEKLVVIKRILSSYARNEAFVGMFLDEARVFSDLRHPNIVAFQEVGEAEGTYYIAMEYIDGRNVGELLAKSIKRGKLMPLDCILQIVHDCAAGLHYAHSKCDPSGKPLNIVHRDVTFRNIMVSVDGITKLLDFGLAKAACQTQLTIPGKLKGTPSYMSPEQLEGHEVSPRSDVFSLGTLLFEMTTRRRLFKRASPVESMSAVLECNVPAPSSVMPDYRKDLESVVLRALERDPAKRYQSAEEMRQALQAVMETLDPRPSTQGLSRFVQSFIADVTVDRMQLFEFMPAVTDGDMTDVDHDLSGWRANAESPMSPDGKSNIPLIEDSFVGRTQLLQSLTKAFDDGQRFVTLVGSGGAGKSRTAIEFAYKQTEKFQSDGGCWFCDLESARSVSELCSAVGHLFGIEIAVDSDPVQTLGRVLENRGPSLIILDTFERLAEVAQQAITQWLEMAPQLSLLITSRQPLELDGEHLIECIPLDLFEEGNSLPEAVTLFVDRAKQVVPNFQTTTQDLEKVSRITRRLDGNPLAIELAAAQMSELTLDKLLRQLNRRFEVLTRKDEGNTSPRRQQTLLAAMDWSWDLLKPHEQAALAQCSVFRAGFDPEAAEAVIDLAEYEPVPWTVEVLKSLRKKSLLTMREPDDFPGEIRYRLYQTIRDFAREKLRTGGTRKQARARHADHYLEIGNRLRRTVGEEKESAWKRLDLELGNLLAVHQRALGRKFLTQTHLIQSIEAALAMHPVLSRRGPLERYLLLLDSSIDGLSQGQVELGLEIEIRMARGQTRRTRGMLSAAKEDINRALELAAVAQDTAAEGRARTELGAIHMDAGQLKQSEDELRAALKIHYATGDLEWQARTLNSLGNIRFICGVLDKARACFENALPLYKAVGETCLAGVCRTNLAMLLQGEGKLEEARTALLEALEIQARNGARLYEAYCLACLGILSHESGSLDKSHRYYDEALAVFAQVGNRRWEGVVHGYLSLLLHEKNDLDAAASSARRCEAILSEVGDLRCKCFFQACLGAIEAARGNVEASARALNSARSQADKLRETLVSMTVEACGAFLDLARDDRANAAKRLSQAQELLNSKQPGQTKAIQSADMSDILRITVRMIKRSLADSTAAN